MNTWSDKLKSEPEKQETESGHIPEGEWYHAKLRERIMDSIRLRKRELFPEDWAKTQETYSKQ